MAKQLLALMDELDEHQFEQFKFLLRHLCPKPRVPWGQLASASQPCTADLLLQHHPRKALALDLAWSLVQSPHHGAAPSHPESAPAPGEQRLLH
ncbi:hypothetical protein Y1Q_0019546 [Alligator mississippiensis]|uniref:Pyrin domain-containing protein n=1 Tax=Alligator mississippiensis TaxID=8496 RepID=A0A151MLP8_ALLMI|nr:hypothetical protein Y1Q_0019546 [Alligator mississippiensis]